VKIAVNTRLLIKNKLDGIGWFTFETLKRITVNHPEHEFIFLFDRNYDESFIFSDNITPIVVGPPARHPFLWYIWFEFSVSRILKKHNVDLFLSPDGYLPLKSKVKAVPVIHDINFVHRPDDLPSLVLKYYNNYFPKFANKANRIATVSEFSKQDIVTNFKIPASKIDVTFNGCNPQYIPVKEEIQIATRAKYSNEANYFLFIGSLHPRKNIANLFLAFDLFKTKTKSDFKLIIVGEKFFKTEKMETVFANMKYKEDVIYTGRLETNELHHVLASAYALTFVPHFEGFGIPLLEAMSCGVPVITSNVTSLPEVAAEAAIYANPKSEKEIAEAMERITTDNELRLSLIEKGFKRRSQFSWDITAQKLWDCIMKVSVEAES